MPERWVARRNLKGVAECEPLQCFTPLYAAEDPSRLSVEQAVRKLIRAGEALEGEAGLRSVSLNGQLVGFIEITRDRPVT